MRFVPCAGRDTCVEVGDRCVGCGRSLAEIERVRRLTDDITRQVLAMGYENNDEFIDYLARKVGKKVRAAQRPAD